MRTIQLTCIRCPRGCSITVECDDEGAVVSVAGNQCRRGDTYARAEVTNPVRTVTTTVPVRGSSTAHVVSVKTAHEVPKDKVFDVVTALADVEVEAPVEIGDVVLANAADTGVDVVATRRA